MRTVRCRGKGEVVCTCPSAAELAARGEKVWEKEVKVEKEGMRRDVVAIFRLHTTALYHLEW
jgi:hypothetical protein